MHRTFFEFLGERRKGGNCTGIFKKALGPWEKENEQLRKHVMMSFLAIPHKQTLLRLPRMWILAILLILVLISIFFAADFDLYHASYFSMENEVFCHVHLRGPSPDPFPNAILVDVQLIGGNWSLNWTERGVKITSFLKYRRVETEDERRFDFSFRPPPHLLRPSTSFLVKCYKRLPVAGDGRTVWDYWLFHEWKIDYHSKCTSNTASQKESS